MLAVGVRVLGGTGLLDGHAPKTAKGGAFPLLQVGLNCGAIAFEVRADGATRPAILDRLTADRTNHHQRCHSRQSPRQKLERF